MSDSNTAVILIIDDDNVSRLALRRLLEKDGYRVEGADDGQAGLELARTLEPDLILLDVIMPGLDGYQVCRALREDQNLAEVPILMLTSLEDQESRILGLDAGADDFLTKPYQPRELKARVRTVTRLNRFRRLRNERARFGWVVEEADVGYLLLNPSGELLYANEKAVALLGLSRSAGKVALKPLLQERFLLRPEAAWEHFPRLEDNAVLYLVHPESVDSKALWFSVKGFSHSAGDRGERLIQIRDVTDEHVSMRSVWSFESVIAHKIRTPLTKISWGLTFLRKKADKLSPEQIVEFAEQADGGVEELKAELEDVLRYVNCPSALPRGPGFLLADLQSLAETTCATLEVPKPQVLVQCPPELRLEMDPRAFELILWEALGNSKKFHPLSSPEVTLLTKAGPKFVTLDILDDGRHLSPQQLERAFSAYFQGEKSFTGQVPGMGLGLTLVRSMLWEVGGECELFNRTDGPGAVLRLRFLMQSGEDS